MTSRLSARHLTGALLLLLVLILFGRPLLRGEAFLPTDQLQHVAPWKAATPETPWNILRFDGITQFYPWRLEAARAFQQGKLPLSNPYAFAASGGTALWANSQSAPLYPPNALFWLLGPDRVWYAFGLSAALHLLILLIGTYLLGRALALERLPALLAAAAFGLSAPIVAWLSLPTFLCGAAWLPWILWAIRREKPLAAGVFAGTALLSGHLQVAFYSLLAGGLLLAHQMVERRAARPWPRVVLAAALAFGLALSLAAPQVVPSIELSRVSHRGGVPASALGFAAYQNNAIPLRHALTYLAPDLFGHPLRNGGVTWIVNRDGLLNNYSEWALYIGVAPILLALTALCLPWRRTDTAALRARRPLALIAGVALLMGFGSPLNLLFYYGVPGFAATGNPGRIGFVAALALSLLAGIGLQEGRSRRAVGLALGVAAIIGALGVAGVAALVRERGLDMPLLMGNAQPGLRLAAVLTLTTAAALLARPGWNAERQRAVGIGLLVLTVVDLAFWGRDYNLSAPRQDVYPETPGIAFLKANGADARIACLNAYWSMDPAGPGTRAGIPPVLPPDSLTVFGLHDIAGYDSLFLREAKEQITEATGAEPSPPENGNLVFVRTIAAARKLGARFIVVPPIDQVPRDQELRVVYSGSDLTIFETPDGQSLPPARSFATGGLRFGLFVGCLGLAALAATVSAGGSRGSMRRSSARSDSGSESTEAST